MRQHKCISSTFQTKGKDRKGRKKGTHQAIGKEKKIGTHHTSEDDVKRKKEPLGHFYSMENMTTFFMLKDNLIKVWDMRKTYTVHKMLPTPKAILKHPKWEGQNFTNLVVSPCQTKLYANSIDGSNYCFNIGVYTEHPIATYKGPPPCTFYTKNSVSPDGRYLSVGSIDSSVYVWNVDNPLPIVKLTGHDMEVTCVDWRPGRGEPMLATCSDDATCRVWRVDPSRHPDAGDKCSDHDDTLKGYAVKQDNVSRLKPRKKFYSCHFKKHRVASKTSINENENTDFSDIPHHLQLTPVKGQPCLTSNLPNLVIDGESPHHHVCPRSTASAHKDTDWLTKLRQSSTPPPPQSSSAGSKSERSSVGRKSSRSATARGGVGKRQRSARGNLMEFFRVAATLRDSQCGAASSAVVADDLTPPVLPTPDFCDLP